MKRFLFYTIALLVPFFVMAQQPERPQYVVFQVSPKNATVTIDGKTLATDSDGIAIFMLENGSYSYTVSANDYRDVSGYIYVEGQKVVKSVELSPAYGWLSIYESEQLIDAKIYVDSILISPVPIKNYKLSSGTHTVHIEHDMYKVFDDRVFISDGETLEYSPKLILRIGTLNVQSTPALARVYVDDGLVGETPLMLDLAIGEHKVDVRKGRFCADTQSVTISEGCITDVKYQLEEQASLAYVENVSGLNMKMIWVEGGTFQMGATSEQGDDADSDETPVHSVTLDSYYIAECEVTQAQWRAIMGSHPSSFAGDDKPVENISWEGALKFCEELSELTGKKYVLPTEAQWEYAARGGKYSMGYKYSGSDNLGDVAWYGDNSGDQTHPVKQKLPNELGLYDMSGNVWEWCSDWYESFSSSDQINPVGASSGSERVLRGGCWFNAKMGCRVSHRVADEPSFTGNGVGFRVACFGEVKSTKVETPSAPVAEKAAFYEFAEVVAVGEEVTEKESPFVKVEQMPSFMGGDLMTFRNWVMKNIKYPQIAQDNNITGRVLLSFVIEKDGSLTNIKVLQTPDSSLSDEAIRILKSSPKWVPGKQRGQTVRVVYDLPINFGLSN